MVGLLSQDPFANLSSLQTMEESLGVSAKDFNLDAGAFFDSANGFAGDSESVNSGGSNADGLDRIQDKQLAIKEKEKKQDEAKELMQYGFLQRQALIQQVTYSNGYFHIGDMKIAEEDMDNAVDKAAKEAKEKPNEIKEKYNMTDAQFVAWTAAMEDYKSANTPQEKARALEKMQEASVEATQEEVLDQAHYLTVEREVDAYVSYASEQSNEVIEENVSISNQLEEQIDPTVTRVAIESNDTTFSL